jgi:hypothetical protein
MGMVFRTRTVKGSPLTHDEVDFNFNHLNLKFFDKTINEVSGGAVTPAGNTSVVVTSAVTINAPSVTPADGLRFTLMFDVDDTSLNWNAIYRGIGGSLPTLTGDHLLVIYNASDDKWDVFV